MLDVNKKTCRVGQVLGRMMVDGGLLAVVQLRLEFVRALEGVFSMRHAIVLDRFHCVTHIFCEPACSITAISARVTVDTTV